MPYFAVPQGQKARTKRYYDSFSDGFSAFSIPLPASVLSKGTTRDKPVAARVTTHVLFPITYAAGRLGPAPCWSEPRLS